MDSTLLHISTTKAVCTPIKAIDKRPLLDHRPSDAHIFHRTFVIININNQKILHASGVQ